jgi:drug/metabolite transporter (DMT)-like permease
MFTINWANWKKSPAIALTALVLVTAVWGSTFLLVKNAITHIPVMDFLAIRFLLAAMVMLALRPYCLRHFDRRGIYRGIILGLFLGGSYIAQTYGLIWASATVSGFITGTFVIFTPFVSWAVSHQKPKWTTWTAVILASIGLALLGLHGWTIGPGEALTMLCAVFIAVHIVALGVWAPLHDAYGLAFIQITTVAVICLIAAIPQGINIPFYGEVWAALGITAIFATALAFVVQTWTLSLVAPTHTAVILTMEPVFAGIFGITFGGEPFTLRIITGAVCVLGAMLLVQLVQKHKETTTDIKLET